MGLPKYPDSTIKVRYMSYSAILQTKTSLIIVTDVNDQDRIFRYNIRQTRPNGDREVREARHRCPYSSKFDVTLLSAGALYHLTSVQMDDYWYVLSAIHIPSGELVVDSELSQFIAHASGLTEDSMVPMLRFRDDTADSERTDVVYGMKR